MTSPGSKAGVSLSSTASTSIALSSAKAPYPHQAAKQAEPQSSNFPQLHAPSPATISSSSSAVSAASSSQPSSSTGGPSFVSESFLDDSDASSSSALHAPRDFRKGGVLLQPTSQMSPLAKQKRASATHQDNKSTSPTSRAHQIDPFLQTVQDAPACGAAFRPPSPALAPALTLSYRCRPVHTQFPSWASLLDSLPKQPRRSEPLSTASRTSESTPAPSSISTHPSSPLISAQSDLTASSLTEATSIAAADSQPSSTMGTPQLTAPKTNAWGTPKLWADTLGRNGLSSKGPIGISVNVGNEHTSASDMDSPSAAHSPKATNGKKSSRKSGAAPSKSTIMSLERLLADAHTRFDAPVTHPRGLVNKGNFCFANAILQMLVYCAPFYNLFSLIGREVPADFGNATPLMEAVIQFLREFLIVDASHSLDSPNLGNDASIAAASEPFVPEFVYDAMRLNKRFDQMRRGHQEDAEEFLGFFLDTLHEELIAAQRRSAIKLAQSAGGPNGIIGKMSEEEKKLNGVSDDDLRRLGVRLNKDAAAGDPVGLGLDAAFDGDEIIEREVMRPGSPSEEGWMEVGQKGKTAFTRTTSTSESPITRIFGGKLRSVLKTPGAKDSVMLEPYQPLQLDIQPAHVQSIEDALLQLTEPDVIHDVWSPSRSAFVDATKQFLIESLPPVLIIHLKRFIYDEIGGVQKSQKPLSYGTTLEIAHEVLSPAMRSQPRPRYRLFGVVYHHGRYASGGHYTVDVLRPDGHSWLHIDDTVYHTVPTEHIVRNASSANKDHGHDGLAYLLFYRRELPGEAEQATASAQAKAAAAPVFGTGKAAVPAAQVNANKHMRVPAAAPALAKGKQQQQQHKGISGAKTPNGSVHSAASSPRDAHASPKAVAASAASKPAKKMVPGWDR